MRRVPQTTYRAVIAMMLVLLMSMMMFPSLASAQEASTPTPVPIEISGVVSQINTGTITVAGLAVDVSNITLDLNVTVGTTVSVTGLLLPTNVIVAQTVVVIVVVDGTSTPTPTPTPATGTPEATATVSPTTTPNPDLIIVIEGPVVNIINNIITIYDFDVEIEPQHPILTIVEIGDLVHVEGTIRGGGVVIASVISNITSVTTVTTGGAATVALEGPVEAIDGNILVINGIPAQLAPNDPLLQTVQVGNFVSVQGNFEGSGANIILVVINVTVINNVIIAGAPFCWFHEGMGMGHWHCDGMGMGMGMGR